MPFLRSYPTQVGKSSILVGSINLAEKTWSLIPILEGVNWSNSNLLPGSLIFKFLAAQVIGEVSGKEIISIEAS